MGSRIHIFAMVWNYPNREGKGNHYLKELMDALAHRNNKVTVAEFKFLNILGFFNVFFKQDGKGRLENMVTRFCFLLPNLLPFIDKLFPLLYKKNILYWVDFNFKKYVKANGLPDLIQHHFILNTPSYITEHLANKYNIPYVVFEHSPNVRERDVILKSKAYMTVGQIKDFVRNAKLRIARSNFFKMEYESLFEINFEVLPSFMSYSFQKQLKNTDVTKSKEKKPFVFIIVGTLQENKAQDKAIYAFIKKFKGNNDYELWIIGSGRLENKYHTIIVENQIESQIKMLGYLPKSQVLEKISKANVLLITSHYETFGNTILEAIFQGIPVLSTTCGGPQDVINEFNGLLCGHEIELISEAMLNIANNYERFDSAKIKTNAVEIYSEYVILSKLLGLYYKLL